MTVRRLSFHGPSPLQGQGSQAPNIDLRGALNNITNALNKTPAFPSGQPSANPSGGVALTLAPGNNPFATERVPFDGVGGCVLRAGRPILRRRRNIPDVKWLDGASSEGISISAGTGLQAGLNADATEAWTTNTNRRFLHGESSPRNLDGVWQDLFIIEVDPVLEVYARSAGGALDQELSEMCTRFLQAQQGFYIDPLGQGQNMALDITLIEDFPVGGIKLDKDQVFQMQRQTHAQFDYFGTGQFADYTLGDIDFGVDITVSIFVGVKVVAADKHPFFG